METIEVAAIRFTQFLRPRGVKQCVQFECKEEPDLVRLADELKEAGWSFEIEVLQNGLINMDVCDEEEPIAQEICDNGPDVIKAVSKLVRDAHTTWLHMGKTRAQGNRGEWLKHAALGERDDRDGDLEWYDSGEHS